MTNKQMVDTIFTMETVPLKIGSGATQEVGEDLRAMGIKKVLLVTDANLVSMGMSGKVSGYIQDAGIQVEVWEKVRIEPTDESWMQAIAFARDRKFQGLVAFGGGSVIDTAKAINLCISWPADLMEYANKPIGRGKAVPGPLMPLIAIPTTAGTGSETTAVCAFEVSSLKVKTGIAHRHLRPRLGIIDPLNTLTVPPAVTASCGIDVLTHALESFLCRPYNERPRPQTPAERPPYVGSNPVSDVWSERAVELVRSYLPRAVRDGGDLDARYQMALASTFAGMGFGNAGTHIPHAMGYPIAGMVRDYVPPGYLVNHPMVPHGIAVVVGAPAAFRYTGSGLPEKHLQAAALLGADTSGAALSDAGAVLADALISFMREMDMPNGISALGYTSADIPGLVEGAMRQQRLLSLSPRIVAHEDMERIFEQALRYW